MYYTCKNLVLFKLFCKCSSSSQESLGGLASGPSWSGAGSGGASPGLPRGVAVAASAVSIASMHQQKKRGIKSSLGRLFSKKEKAGLPVSDIRLNFS